MDITTKQTSLANKLIWITGASSGIGLAIAMRLLADGYRVRGFSRRDPVIQSPHYQHETLDLSKASMPHLDEVPYAFVHAAGLMHTAPVGHLAQADGQAMWQLHVAAAEAFANLLLPAMQAQKEGRVVVIGSRVSVGKAGRSQYAATKAAMVAMARSWAAEVVADGVTVNVVSPAATDTPMLHGGMRASSAPVMPPIGRLIRPSEVAALVAFLLSQEAAAITGQDIAVCGGSSLPR